MYNVLPMQYPTTDRRNEENLKPLSVSPAEDNSNGKTPKMGSHRTGASGQGQAAVPTSPYGPDGFALGKKSNRKSFSVTCFHVSTSI
jgi:hypothetical protein